MIRTASRFFFNNTATTEIYTLSLHDRSSDLPSYHHFADQRVWLGIPHFGDVASNAVYLIDRPPRQRPRSEEHTSELQSLRHLVCRLLLEKKNKASRPMPGQPPRQPPPIARAA